MILFTQEHAEKQTVLHPTLEDALTELADAQHDFETAGFQNAVGVIARLTDCFDREPLSLLARSLLPRVDFQAWWEACQATKGSGAGSGSFNWPVDRGERVAIQLELCRAIARGDLDLLDICIGFCFAGREFDDNLIAFSDRVLRPFLRDLTRIAKLRISPPILAEALAGPLPESGDETLDSLLRAARDAFRDQNPSARQFAVEKLWDAWERMKTLEDRANKQRSVSMLLEHAARDPAFRSVLEADARALTEIGNQFHIRHFELDRAAIAADAQIDYLFHRLWALIWLLLKSRPTID